MKINNKEFNDFNAKVISFFASTMEINNNLQLLKSSYNPISGARKLSVSERNLVIDFINEDDISNFTVEIMKESVIDIEDEYIYKTWLKKSPVIIQDGYQAYTATYNLYVIKQKPMIILDNQLAFEVLGNIASEVIIELTTSRPVTKFEINDYTINNLKANDTFVIDGINKLVYYSSNPEVSVFDDIDLTEFPKFESGYNEINISDDTVNVVLKYRPTFM